MTARKSAGACFGLLVFLFASVSVAQTQPVATQGVRLPDRSVSVQDNASSVEVNPAGLGFLESAEFRYNFDLAEDFRDDTLRDQHAVFAAAGTRLIAGAFGVQLLDRRVSTLGVTPYQKYSFGTALRPFSSWSFGVGLSFFGSSRSQRLNGLTSLDVGTQWRPARFLGLGLAIKELNHPFVQANRGLPVRLQPGFAIRLLNGALVVDSAVDWTPDNGNVSYAPRLSGEPLEGLRLFARAEIPIETESNGVGDDTTRIIGGVEVALGHVGLEAAPAFDIDGGDDAYAGHAQSVYFSTRGRPALVRPGGRWVLVDLTGGIAERALESPLRARKRSFLNLLTRLRAIADDKSVDGLIFKIGNSGLGYGQAWELRQQIAYLNESGKATASYLMQPSFVETYIASGTDHLLLLPSEPYEPAGVSISELNYADALSKAGIQAEFVRIGDYKSAPEAFVRSEPSKESIEQTTAYVDALYQEVVGSIAGDRNLTDERVEKAVDEIPLLPDEAVEEGFADRILYPDELRPHLQQSYGVSRLLEPGYDPNAATTQGWEGGPEVAVVYIDGNIVEGKSSQSPLFGQILSGSETISKILERLGQDPNVRAIVIRVDSPGGSAVGSDLIYRQIRRVAQVKPVVTSMGDIAASGGYYVAAGADKIYATPNTLTGSIGIFAGKFSVQRLASFLGINHSEIRRGKRAGQFGIFKPWSEEERKRITKSIHYLYWLFLEQAAETRPLTAQQIDKVARGRVWVGTDAKKEKLVDENGGLIDAIHEAERLAGLQPGTARYRSYPSPKSFLDLPMTQASIGQKLLEAIVGETSNREASRKSAFGKILDSLHSAVLVPLVYGQEEPLMLPPKALDVE